ncbi:MAG: hypothetical protein WA441_11830 [Methyloceanibacter sp.]
MGKGTYKRKQELDANDSDESSADSIFGDEQTTTTRCGGQGLGAVELKPAADDERAAPVIDGACLNEEANVCTAYLINWRAIIDSDAEKEDGKNARA